MPRWARANTDITSCFMRKEGRPREGGMKMTLPPMAKAYEVDEVASTMVAEKVKFTA
jgi:hypothetical protein